MAEVVSLSLYDVESALEAILNTEETCPEELKHEWVAEWSEKLQTAVQKRDQFAHAIINLDHLIEGCDEEIDRLKARKDRMKKARERLCDLGSRIIVGLGQDSRGRYRKLEGKSCTLSVRKSRDRVVPSDESQVPLEYKRLTLKMMGNVWESIVSCIPEEIRASLLSLVKADAECDLRSIGMAFDRGETVPGADIVFGEYRLDYGRPKKKSDAVIDGEAA